MTTRYNTSLLSQPQQERLVELTEQLNEGIPLLADEQEELDGIMQDCLETHKIDVTKIDISRWTRV